MVRTGPARSITSRGDRRFRVPFKDKPTQMDTWPGYFLFFFLSTLIDRGGDGSAPVNCGSPIGGFSKRQRPKIKR